MNAFKFTVGGKDYTNDIHGGVEAMMHKVVMNAMQNKLEHLMQEIEKEGATIEFDLQSSEFSIKNCSPELIEKIQTAIKN